MTDNVLSPVRYGLSILDILVKNIDIINQNGALSYKKLQSALTKEPINEQNLKQS